jgi:uncharacterized protein (DUF1697 family)
VFFAIMNFMNTYLILLRGINVGGKNKISMTELKRCLEVMGFSDVLTYIASGNVIVKSNKKAEVVQALIEKALPENFRLDSELLKVLVLAHSQLKAIVKNKPKGFGEQPNKYHSDAIFLMGIEAAQAMPVFSPKEGVDKIWIGTGVINSQRLSALRTKSRLNRIMVTPLYKSMTIRSWGTTTGLLDLMEKVIID